MHWRRHSQEREGTYFFSGQLYVTHAVAETLSPAEILAICLDIQVCVTAYNGIDYFQVYENEEGRKLFFIDQLNKEMIESGRYPPGENYCTLLFSSEY